MADARRLGEIAGPMIDRLLAKRARFSHVYERDEDVFVLVPTVVVYVEWSRVQAFVSFGQWSFGVAWRRFA